MTEETQKSIKKGYEEYDKWFEHYEVPPYNAAYLYYEAGYLRALSDLENYMRNEERGEDAV